jgi:hypothetical protein
MENKSRSIDTRKLFLLNLPHFIKYVFSGQVLPVVGLLSLAFLIIPINILFFVFVNIAIIPMVYKFAFDVLADTARGNMSPHVRANYLVSNVIIIKVIVVALLIEGTLFMIRNKGVDKDYIFAFIVFSTFIIPAIYMVLALTNSLVSALNPLVLFQVVKTTFFSYFIFVLFWASIRIVFEFFINPLIYYYLPTFVNGVASTYINYTLLVLNFHIMGYILFQHRRDFDLEDLGFESIEDDTIEVQTVITNPIHERIKMLLADDEAQLALAMVIELQKEGDRSSDLQDLYKKAMDMKLYSPSNLDIAHKVHDRLNKNQISRAFNTVIDHIESGKDYVEISPEDIKKLVQHAIQIDKTQYTARLIKDFHVKYPYHADIVPNYFLLAKILYNDRATRDKSKELLAGLIQKYPKDPCMKEIKQWYQGVELMSQKNL